MCHKVWQAFKQPGLVALALEEEMHLLKLYRWIWHLCAVAASCTARNYYSFSFFLSFHSSNAIYTKCDSNWEQSRKMWKKGRSVIIEIDLMCPWYILCPASQEIVPRWQCLRRRQIILPTQLKFSHPIQSGYCCSKSNEICQKNHHSKYPRHCSKSQTAVKHHYSCWCNKYSCKKPDTGIEWPKICCGLLALERHTSLHFLPWPHHWITKKPVDEKNFISRIRNAHAVQI